MIVQIPPPDGYDGPGETINEQAFWRRGVRPNEKGNRPA